MSDYQELRKALEVRPASIDDSDRLLPCPFCGGPAEMDRVQDARDPNFGGCFVACLRCGCTSTLHFPSMDDPRWLLMERWNCRTNTAADPSTIRALLAERDALRAELDRLKLQPTAEDAAALVDKRREGYDIEHGWTDSETGAREYPGNGAGDEYVLELFEIAEAIRAIPPKAKP